MEAVDPGGDVSVDELLVFLDRGCAGSDLFGDRGIKDV